jgi:hypothetical protein
MKAFLIMMIDRHGCTIFASVLRLSISKRE